MNFKAVLALPKTARSAQTHKSISFIWIVWSTLYVYLCSSPRKVKVDLCMIKGSKDLIYLTLLYFIVFCTLVSNAKGNIAKSNKSELWNLAKVEQGSYKNRIGHRHNLKLIFTLIMSKGGKKNCYAGADTACCQEEIGKHVVSLAISRCI